MATKQTKEIGKTGLDEWRGYIKQDFLRELRGKEGYKRYNEMRLNSPVVGALLMAIELPIRQTEWQVMSDDGEDDERIDFIKQSLDNMSLSLKDHVSEALTMLPFGYSLFEIVYERVGGKLLWRKFGIRGQDTIERWEFDESGGIQGAYQRVVSPTYGEALLPIDKCLLYRTRAERNNPEGLSILRNAWVSYYYVKNIQQIEAIGIERDLAGLPMIKLPEGADTSSGTNTDAGKADKMVRNVRNDEQSGLVMPAGWEFSLVSTGGSRQFDTNAIVSRYESRMLMSALAQFLILGMDKVGTQALSSDMTKFFGAAIEGFADIIADTFTRYAIPRLLTLNGYDPDGISLVHGPIEDIDLAQLGDFLQKAGNKITWTVQDEMWLRDAAELPNLEADQIEEEREKNRAMLPQFGMTAPQAPPEAPQDDMSVDLFASGRSPDDKERRKFENVYKNVWANYFGEQEKRVVSAAKRARRG